MPKKKKKRKNKPQKKIQPSCIYEECVLQRGKHRRISFKENGKSVIVILDKGISVKKVKVDGCVIKNQTACDFLLIAKKKVELLIELKGVDVKSGVKQLICAYKEFSKTDALPCSITMNNPTGLLVKQGHIPNLKIVKYKNNYNKETGGILKILNNKTNYKI